MQKTIDQKTQQQVIDINKNVQVSKEKAMQKLLKIVCDIRAELHTNYHA